MKTFLGSVVFSMLILVLAMGLVKSQKDHYAKILRTPVSQTK